MSPAITVLENRLIAFLDVLGFSARLALTTTAECLLRYQDKIDTPWFTSGDKNESISFINRPKCGIFSASSR